MRNKIFEEDKMLTKAVETPSEKKPRFNWARSFGSQPFQFQKYALRMARVTVISISPRWLMSLGKH